MGRTRYVGTGEVIFGHAGDILESTPLGSCIAVCVYDSRLGVGGMAHVMLPGEAPENESEKNKYALNAVEALSHGMRQMGCEAASIDVCLIGAANVLDISDDTISRKNLDSVLNALREKNLKISAESVGGTLRRSAKFDVKNGAVFFSVGDDEERLLWGASSKGLKEYIEELERVKDTLKKKEETLKEHEANMSILLDTVSTQIWFLTDEVTYGAVNKAHADFNNTSIEAMSYRTIYDLFPKDVADVCRDGNRRVFNEKKAIRTEAWVTHFSGTKRRLSIMKTPRFAPDGTVQYVVCSAEDVTDQKKGEIIFHESEEEFRILFDKAPVSYQSLNKDGRFLYVNQTWLDTLGYVREDVVGRYFGDFLTSEYAELFKTRFPLFLKAKEVHDAEFDMIRKDGRVIRVSFEGRTREDDAGNFLQTHCIFIDITERRNLENALKDKETVLSGVVDSLEEAVHLVDSDLCVHFFNRKFKTWSEELGISLDNFIGRPLKELFPFLSDSTIGEYKKVLESGQSFTTREETVFCNGRRIITEVRKIPVRLADEKMSVLTIVSDITDLEESRFRMEALSAVVESSDNIIAVKDLDLKVIAANSAFAHVSGHASAEELIGKNDADIFGVSPYSEPIKTYMEDDRKAQTLPNGESIVREEPVILPDGSTRIVLTKKYPIYNNEKKVIATGHISVDITEQKKVEYALRESEKRFDLAIAGTGAGLWDWDMCNNSVYFSPEWKRMLGYAEDEIENDFMGWKKLWHPGDSEKIEQAINDYILKKREKYEIEHRLRHKDGGWRWILTRGEITRDEHGTPIRWVGTNIDLTRIKETELLLKEKSDELDLYFSSSLDLLCIANTSGQFIRLNPAWETTLGFPLSELLGRSFLDFVHPNDLNRTLAAISQLEKQEEILSFENRYRCKDGTYRWIEWRSRPLGTTIYAVARDITERKGIEDKLRESEKNQRLLTEHAVSGIAVHEIVLDDTGNPIDYVFLSVNPAFEKHTGLKMSQVIGKRITEVMSGIEKTPFIDIYGKVVLTGEPVSFEDYAPPLERYFSINAYSLGKGRFATVFSDITEKKRAEEELKAKNLEFEHIFNNSHIGILYLRSGRVLVRTNQRLADILGYATPEEMQGLSMRTFHLSDERFNDFGAKHYEKLSEGEQFQVEYQLRRKDGTPVWCSLSGKALDTNDLNRGVIWVVDELEDRKRAEEALSQAYQNLRTILHKAPFGVAIIDKNRTIRWVNQAVADMAGIENFSEIEGKPCARYLCLAEHDECPILDTGETLESSERIFRRADGKIIPVLKTVTQINLGGDDVFLETFIDITKHKKVEEELRYRREQFMLAVKGTNDGFWDWDIRKSNLFLSEKWKEQLGYQNSELVNNLSTFESLVHPDDKKRVMDNFARYLKNEIKSYAIEFRLRHKDGSYRWILARGDSVRDEDGLPIRMPGSHTDITERKQAEEEIKNKLKEIEHRNKLMMAREERILEIKSEVNKLLGELGREKKYKTVIESD
jgi:PAS domain S-box-containing protein